MIALIAKLRIKDGSMDDAQTLFRDLIPEVSKEEGTVSYTVNKDMADPNLLVIVERYRDMGSLQAHTGSPSFAAFSKKIGAMMEGKLEMTLLEELASI
ncbi:MAG: putative quinol monooxygenase [Smithellaceae bacterium]|nr:putative quinol monooxygenase [Smithellaceae bacterium]